MVENVPRGVAEGVARLGAGAQHVGVEAVGEDLAAAARVRVEAARAADGEALHAADEGGAVRRLDDEVQVRALDFWAGGPP